MVATVSATLARSAQFLEAYEDLWSEEVLVRYPRYEEAFPPGWIDEIAALEPDARYRLEREQDYSGLSKRLAEYFIEANAISCVERPQIAPLSGFARNTFHRVSRKKQHEIERVAAFVAGQAAAGLFEDVLDFCGGVGYLSHVLAEDCGLRVLSLDRDRTLHARGEARLMKLFGEEARNRVRYLAADLEHAPREIGESIARPLLLGLHTCGSLAVRQIEQFLASDAPALLNVGCCYYKMSEPYRPLSAAGRGYRVLLSDSALTAASRSPTDTPKAYHFSKRVKRYRYAMHLFLFHHCGIEQFQELGKSSRSLYESPFSEYGVEQLRRIDRYRPGVEHELDAFFEAESIQKEVQKMSAANLLRAVAGRPIELFVLADRAEWLREHGVEASLLELFDSAVSPRNIALWAVK